MNHNQLYTDLLHRLKQVRTKEHLFSLLSYGSLLLSIVFIIATIAVGIEAFVHGNTSFRTALFYGSVGTILLSFGIIGFFLTKTILYRSSMKYLEQVSLRVGRKYTHIVDSLCNVLQLYSSVELAESNPLVLAQLDVVHSSTKSVDFSTVAEKQSLKRSAGFLLFTTISLLMLWSFGSSFMLPASERVINFTTSYVPPAPFTLRVNPEFQNISRGEKASIFVKATGEIPKNTLLFIKDASDKEYTSIEVRFDTNGTFQYDVPSFKQTLEFYAEAPWLVEKVQSNIGRIAIIDRPLILSMKGTAVPPSYSKLQSVEFSSNMPSFTTLKGSMATFSIASNKSLRSAKIFFVSKEKQNDTTVVNMSVSNSNASLSTRLYTSSEYYIEITDNDGLTNAEKPNGLITLLTDGYPSISLIEPMGNVTVNEQGLVPIQVTINDDFGFSKLVLHYRLASSRYAQPSEKFQSKQIEIRTNELFVTVPYVWNLQELGFTIEDEYEFYLEIFDNDNVSGPKSAITAKRMVKLPSLDDVLAETDKSQDDIEKQLKEIAKASEQANREMENIKREMRKQQSPSWKEKKSLEDLQKKQQAAQEKLNQIQDKLQDVTEQLNSNKLLSPETLEKYQELQKLLKEVKNPELQAALERMQKQMEQMNPNDMQKAMEQYQMKEEEFKKSIERTMKLLQRMKAEQKADALAKKAEDIKNRQEQLQKQTENTNANNEQQRQDLAKEQANLQKEMDDLAKELKDLEQLMKDIGKNMPMDEMKKTQESLQQQQISEKMQKSEQSLQKGDMNSAKQQQQQASQSLQQFSQQMKNLRKEMQKNISKEAQKQMQKSINDMLSLSQKQEQIKQQTEKLDPNSSQFKDLQQQQSQLQDALQNTANQLMQLSQKSMSVTPEMGKEIGNALSQMQQAQEMMDKRGSQQAAQKQGQAMASMNNAAMQMQQALGQMQGKGKGKGQGGEGEGEGQGEGQGGSFMDKLRQAAGQQQSINQQMQQMMGKNGTGGNQGSMSQQEQAQMQRLAAQQGKLQKSIEELAKEQKDSYTGKRKALGDLEKISDELKEVVRAMQQGDISEETRNRQERILSRLLDASKSMNERDMDPKREANAGKDMFGSKPGPLQGLTPEQREQSLKDMLQSLKLQYTKEYEILIKQYFETVQ